MAEKLKVGIAGFGMIGPVHFYNIWKKSRDLAEVVAIADPDENQIRAGLEKAIGDIRLLSPEITDAEIERLRKTRTFNNYMSLFYGNSADINVVHICLPHDMHLGVIERGIKNDKHIIVEKPLVLSSLEARHILRIQKIHRYQKKIGLISQNRYNDEISWLKQQIDKYWPIKGIEVNVDWYREQKYYDLNEGWRGKNRRALGGVLTNQAYHQLDLALWLMDYKGEDIDIEDRVNSTNKNLHPNIEVSDTVSGIIRLDNGFIKYYGTTCNPEKIDITKFKVHFNKGYIELINEGGKVYTISDFLEVPEEFDKRKDAYNLQLGRPSYGFGHADNIRYAYEAMLNGTTPPISLEDGINVLKVTDAILGISKY